MYKIVDVFSFERSVFIEEFYFDDNRLRCGYGDTFTNISRVREFPVPAWADVKDIEDEVWFMFLKNNKHTKSIGFILNDADRSRLEEVKYAV